MPLYHAACQWHTTPKSRKGESMLHAHGTPLIPSAVPSSMPFSSKSRSVTTCSMPGHAQWHVVPECGGPTLRHAGRWHAACGWSAKWHAFAHAARGGNATVQRWRSDIAQCANRMPSANFTHRILKSDSLSPGHRDYSFGALYRCCIAPLGLPVALRFALGTF